MESKYSSVGLNYSLIHDKYKDISEYEDIINCYFDDENFKLLKEYLENEDWAMAKDATKGLYVLASELFLYPIYEALLDLFEDLEDEEYIDVLNKYEKMYNIYNHIRSKFYV